MRTARPFAQSFPTLGKMLLAPLFLLIQLAVLYWVMGASSGPLRFLVVQIKTGRNSGPEPTRTACLAHDGNLTSTDCGRCLNVTSGGGVIVSPNYPGAYGLDLYCLFHIGVPAGMRIRLMFPTFAIRSPIDLLTVDLISFNFKNDLKNLLFRSTTDRSRTPWPR